MPESSNVRTDPVAEVGPSSPAAESVAVPEATRSFVPDARVWLPWLQALRASGIALGVRKLLLGAFGLLLLWLGELAFSLLPFAPVQRAELPWFDQGTQWLDMQRGPTRIPVDSAHGILQGINRQITPPDDQSLLWPVLWPPQELLRKSCWAILRPVTSVLGPAFIIFRNGNTWSDLAWAWTRLLWALIVWSLIGGAIARLSALQFAKHDLRGIRYALRFSRQQFLAYLVAPLLPLSGIGCLAGFNAVLGWLAGLVPAAGSVVLGVLWGLILFLGFLMATMSIGIALGWPLMVAAISTEDSDGFDGLSRAFGFLFDRPWYALFLANWLLLIGWLSLFVLMIVAALTDYMANWSVAAGFGKELMAQTGGSLVNGWLAALSGLVAGFGASFFWSGSTVIYFLLRLSDDGTPLSDVVTIRDEATS